MPPIDRLNPLPNPFWGFMADMRDHPIFAPYDSPPPNPIFGRRERAAPQGTPATTDNNINNNNSHQEKKPDEKVEDPPEVDPATIYPQGRERHHIPFRGRQRGDNSGSDDEGRRRRRCHGRRGWGGPQPAENSFGQLGGPFAGPGRHQFPSPPHLFGTGAGHDAQARAHAHAHAYAHLRANAQAHARARAHAHTHGRGGFSPRGGPFHHGHGGHHGHQSHHGARGPWQQPNSTNFDMGQFLSDLGTRIGMDLNGAAQSLGLDRFMPTSSSSPDIDFEPRVDIFDRPAEYVVHVSLPGAKKSDLGVDWDGEHSALRVGGVVHRPEVDETMLGQLVVDGRKRETGVFEKLIRLGTRNEPANVDVGRIRARMTDGVLIVTAPKMEKADLKREVPIAKSQTPSPVREVEQEMQQPFFDATYNYGGGQPDVDMPMGGDDKTFDNGEIHMIDHDHVEKSDKGKQAELVHEMPPYSRVSTGTVQAEDDVELETEHIAEPEPEPEPERLPAYQPTAEQYGRGHVREHDRDLDDWENFGSDEEGEYVKINVD